MTVSEAIEMLEQCGLNIEQPKHDEVLNVVVEALEKQIPKKVYKNLKETYGIDTHPYHCPTCKRYVSLRGYVRRDKFPVNKRYVYCNYCGQALDWSDTE